MKPPRVITEDQLDQEFQVRSKLKSGGDYGCMCLVFEGDFVSNDPVALEDNFFYGLNSDVDGDVGTIVFTGDVTCTGHACISDRLMCLIVLGDLSAEKLSIFETEVLVCGNLEVGELNDHDDYLNVLGTSHIL